MSMIQAVPVRDLKNNYNEVEDMIKNHNIVWVTKNGRNSAVIINPEDYQDYENYKHEQYVYEKLQEAIKEAKSPDTEWFDFDTVINALKEKYVSV